jgi:hypothetical protein
MHFTLICRVNSANDAFIPNAALPAGTTRRSMVKPKSGTPPVSTGGVQDNSVEPPVERSKDKEVGGRGVVVAVVDATQGLLKFPCPTEFTAATCAKYTVSLCKPSKRAQVTAPV